MTRKIIQIAVCGDTPGDPELVALCNDGTVFMLTMKGWIEVPAIPQPPSQRALMDAIADNGGL